jgi:hypothetical protein
MANRAAAPPDAGSEREWSTAKFWRQWDRNNNQLQACVIPLLEAFHDPVKFMNEDAPRRHPRLLVPPLDVAHIADAFRLFGLFALSNDCLAAAVAALSAAERFDLARQVQSPRPIGKIGAGRGVAKKRRTSDLLPKWEAYQRQPGIHDDDRANPRLFVSQEAQAEVKRAQADNSLDQDDVEEFRKNARERITKEMAVILARKAPGPRRAEIRAWRDAELTRFRH